MDDAAEVPFTQRIEGRRRKAPNQARHARKCTVCHHPDRKSIDAAYLNWRSPELIARERGIAHHSNIYRHARATGLWAQRRASLRATLSNFIEQAENVRVTAGSLISAVRLFAQINDDGQWAPPPRRTIVEYRYSPSLLPEGTPEPAGFPGGTEGPPPPSPASVYPEERRAAAATSAAPTKPNKSHPHTTKISQIKIAPFVSIPITFEAAAVSSRVSIPASSATPSIYPEGRRVAAESAVGSLNIGFPASAATPTAAAPSAAPFSRQPKGCFHPPTHEDSSLVTRHSPLATRTSNRELAKIEHGSTH